MDPPHRDRGGPRGPAPPTRPCVRVRTGRFVRSFRFALRHARFSPFPRLPRGFTPRRDGEGQFQLDLLLLSAHESCVLLAPAVRAFGSSRSLLCPLLTSAARSARLPARSVPIPGRLTQTSRGKSDRLPRTTARSTLRALGGYGLCDDLPARPALMPSIWFLSIASRVCSTLPSAPASQSALALRFANPSPPPGWIEDFHFRALGHARHTDPSLRFGMTPPQPG